MAELMHLKTPAGWVILDNKLYDTEPIIEESSTHITNWYEGFVNDVVWIHECRLNENGKVELLETDFFNIDVSWLPDSNINGAYYATLSWCRLEEMVELEKFQSTNRFEIRDKIEFWMSDIKDNSPDYMKRVIG